MNEEKIWRARQRMNEGVLMNYYEGLEIVV